MTGRPTEARREAETIAALLEEELGYAFGDDALNLIASVLELRYRFHRRQLDAARKREEYFLRHKAEESARDSG